MTVYENVSLYIEREGFVKDSKGKLGQYTYDLDDPKQIAALQFMANNNKKSVYVVREFVAVDADYQDQHPKKSAKDWYILEIKPEAT